jgi:hypothetical protein
MTNLITHQPIFIYYNILFYVNKKKLYIAIVAVCCVSVSNRSPVLSSEPHQAVFAKRCRLPPGIFGMVYENFKGLSIHLACNLHPFEAQVVRLNEPFFIPPIYTSASSEEAGFFGLVSVQKW